MAARRKDPFVGKRGRGQENNKNNNGNENKNKGNGGNGNRDKYDPQKAAREAAARAEAAKAQQELVQQQIAQSQLAYDQATAAQDQANSNVAYQNAPAIIEPNSPNPFAPVTIVPGGRSGGGGNAGGNGGGKKNNNKDNLDGPLGDKEYRLWQNQNQEEAFNRYLADNIGIDPFAQNDVSSYFKSLFSKYQSQYAGAVPDNRKLSFQEFLDKNFNAATEMGGYRNWQADSNKDSAIDTRLRARGFDTSGTNSFSNWLNTEGASRITQDYESAKINDGTLQFNDYLNNYNTKEFRDLYANLDGTKRGVKTARPGRWVAFG